MELKVAALLPITFVDGILYQLYVIGATEASAFREVASTNISNGPPLLIVFTGAKSLVIIGSPFIFILLFTLPSGYAIELLQPPAVAVKVTS